VEQDIRLSNPSVIIAVGEAALESLFGPLMGDLDRGIPTWRGWAIPDRRRKCWVVPIIPPTKALERDAVMMRVLVNDLAKAFSLAATALPPFPPIGEEESCVILEPPNLPDLLKKAGSQKGLVGFDYETTGIKPHRPQHRIVCCGFSPDKDHSYAFRLTDDNVGDWIAFLESPCPKTAHNKDFEGRWSKVTLNRAVRNMVWDSLLAAHVEDNRGGVAGLKFQAAVHFGVWPYGEEVRPFLETPLNKKEEEMGANAINRITHCDITKLLTYCGIDALIQRRLAILQRRNAQ
jgi:hypothetical protein